MPRNKGIAKAARDRRRQEAIARKAEYDQLTPEQKLARLDAAGYRAEKQRRRLQRQVEEAAPG